MKQESQLRSDFLRRLIADLPHFVALRREGIRYSGQPDVSIIGNKRSSELEFKHATPEFSGTGLQELMGTRLEAQGFCRYVVWFEMNGTRRTMVIRPSVVQASPGTPKRRKPWLMEPEEVAPGFDHQWLVEWVKQVHRC